MGFKSRQSRGSKAASAAASDSDIPVLPLLPVQPLDDTLRLVISTALAAHGSLRAAAKALDVPYSSLRDKADKYGLSSQWSEEHPKRSAAKRRRRGKVKRR